MPAFENLRLRRPSIAGVVHLTTSVSAFILLAGTVVSQAIGDDGSHLRKQSRQTGEEITERHIRHLQLCQYYSNYRGYYYDDCWYEWMIHNPDGWIIMLFIIYLIFRGFIDWSNVDEYRRLKREELLGRLDEASRDRLRYLRGPGEHTEEGVPVGLECCVFWGDVFRECHACCCCKIRRETPPSRRVTSNAAYSQMMRHEERSEHSIDRQIATNTGTTADATAGTAEPVASNHQPSPSRPSAYGHRRSRETAGPVNAQEHPPSGTIRTNYGSLRDDTMTPVDGAFLAGGTSSPVRVAGARSSLGSNVGRRGRTNEGARTERDSLISDGGVEESPCSFEEATCCICMDAPPVYAFVPCGHLCLCETCQKAYDQTNCPLCGVGYSLIMKLY